MVTQFTRRKRELLRLRCKRCGWAYHRDYFPTGIELGLECTIMIDNIKHLAKMKVKNDCNVTHLSLSKEHQLQPFEHSFETRKDFYYWPAIVCETCNCGEKGSIPSRQFQVSWE